MIILLIVICLRLVFQVYQTESQSEELSEEEEEGRASEPALATGEEGSQPAPEVSLCLILKRSYRAMGTAKDTHTETSVPSMGCF